MALLEVRGVEVSFGGQRALRGVDLDVDAGRVTGLIGPNGAGKTTLFDVVTGLRRPDRGAVVLAGRDVRRLPPHRRARLGLARTFQRLELFGSLTVRDNVLVAAEIGRGHLRHPHTARRDAEELIDRLGLRPVADRRADTLPTGSARLVELARALVVRPRVLLLDEPASGLDDVESASLATVIAGVAAQGTAVLLVEHDVALVMDVCERVYVLDTGAVLAAGPPAAIQRDEAVVAAYLGAARVRSPG